MSHAESVRSCVEYVKRLKTEPMGSVSWSPTNLLPFTKTYSQDGWELSADCQKSDKTLKTKNKFKK